jgi:hypothetical protein
MRIFDFEGLHLLASEAYCMCLSVNSARNIKEKPGACRRGPEDLEGKQDLAFTARGMIKGP